MFQLFRTCSIFRNIPINQFINMFVKKNILHKKTRIFLLNSEEISQNSNSNFKHFKIQN